MDFTTFKESALIIDPEVSVMMRGRHGIGKTQLVREIAKDINLPIIERRLSQLTEGDLLGLPKIDGKATTFLPPDWFVKAMESPHLIFLDELDRSTEQVEQAAMEFILERSIQGKRIHPRCRIFSAINGGKYGALYNVRNMDPAVMDRFWIADVEPTVEEWLDWANNNILSVITEFIKIYPNHLEHKNQTQDPNKITPSRRSWTRLSKTLEKNMSLVDFPKKKSKTLISICSGFVGYEATGKFRDFLINRDGHIFVSDILDNFYNNKDRISKFDIQQLNVAIDKIVENNEDLKAPLWTNKQAQNIEEFCEMLPAELRLTMWDKISGPNGKFENVKKIGSKLSKFIIAAIKS